jgi:hypothetical protein
MSDSKPGTEPLRPAPAPIGTGADTDWNTLSDLRFAELETELLKRLRSGDFD